MRRVRDAGAARKVLRHFEFLAVPRPFVQSLVARWKGSASRTALCEKRWGTRLSNDARKGSAHQKEYMRRVEYFQGQANRFWQRGCCVCYPGRRMCRVVVGPTLQYVEGKAMERQF